jgi:hypothetical protein
MGRTNLIKYLPITGIHTRIYSGSLLWYFITETVLINARITYIMARGQKISATTYHHAVLDALLENYFEQLPAKGRKSTHCPKHRFVNAT